MKLKMLCQCLSPKKLLCKFAVSIVTLISTLSQAIQASTWIVRWTDYDAGEVGDEASEQDDSKAQDLIPEFSHQIGDNVTSIYHKTDPCRFSFQFSCG